MKKYTLFFFLLIFSSWMVYREWPVKVRISGPEDNFTITMPSKDKNRLDFFFKETCIMDAWAYTLMGSKPVSIQDYKKPWIAFKDWFLHPTPPWKDIPKLCLWPPNFQNIKYFVTPFHLRMKLGWETLQKHVSQFDNSRFELLTDTYEKGIFIVLVNKTHFVSIVQQHLDDFQKTLERDVINPMALLHEAKTHRFEDVVKGHFILGIVLGFGKENAALWSNGDRSLLTTAWPDEENKNLDQINQKILSNQPFDLSDMFYPRFACNLQSEETKRLKKKYKKEREAILNYYQGKDFVEATLSLFNQ